MRSRAAEAARLQSAAVDLDVVFLGTSGSAPTARRSPSATMIRRGGDRILIDCGEGTQRQLLRSDVGLVDLEEVFLTHLHADHYLGLPGMLKTFALRGRDQGITIYGPRGTRTLIASLGRIFGRLTYDVEIEELDPGDSLPRDGWQLETFATDHRIESIGYALIEDDRPGRFDVGTADGLGIPSGPERGRLQRGETVTLADGRVITPEQVLGGGRQGRRVVVTGDTAPCAAVVDVSRGADLLVHEATFLTDEADRASETGHSTAAEAARVARDAGVRLLALTHVSGRYGGREVEREARAVYDACVVPRDFDLIEIPFPERGAPCVVPRGARLPRRPADPAAAQP
jgi:ribonuclease Z